MKMVRKGKLDDNCSGKVQFILDVARKRLSISCVTLGAWPRGCQLVTPWRVENHQLAQSLRNTATPG